MVVFGSFAVVRGLFGFGDGGFSVERFDYGCWAWFERGGFGFFLRFCLFCF